MNAPITDVHVHYTPASLQETFERATRANLALDELLAVITKGRRDILTRLNDRLEEMDVAGVEHAVLSVPPPGALIAGRAAMPAICASSNDELLEAAATDPARFSALISLPFPEVEASLQELERVGGHPLTRGIILFTVNDDWTVDDPTLERVYARISDLGLPVMLHPTFDDAFCSMSEYNLAHSLGAPVSSSLAALRLILSGTLDRVPALTLIQPHLGGVLPYLAQRLDDQSPSGAIEHPVTHYLRHRFLFDTCSFHPPALDLAVATVGADRLLLGSDSPFRGSINRSIRFVTDSRLSADEQQLILATTADTHLGPSRSANTGSLWTLSAENA